MGRVISFEIDDEITGHFDALVAAAKRAPDKLIFGSDGPLLHPGVELSKVLELPLTPTQQRNVLGSTIRRLLPRSNGDRP